MTVKDKMDQLSKSIDQKINGANLQIPFANHFSEWWQSYNNQCGELYNKAGSEYPSSVHPVDAENWLEDQINKLHKFLSKHAESNKTA